MKNNKIHIGRRTLKTAAAVIIAMILVSFYGATTSKMVFAMLGAMDAMEPTFKKSLKACLTQIVGMFFGVIAGVILLSLPIHWLLCVGIGIVLIITLYNVFQIRFSPVLPCLVIVTVCITPDIQPFTYAIGRLWDTMIGLGVGLLINVLVLPYDNSMKIRNSMEYLQREVVHFLEDMFDGDKCYPDTNKMTKTIDAMAGQLTILSEQWFLLKVKRNYKRIEVLRECEGKSRQLLAHMEVLSRMNTPGRLTEDNKRLLMVCGVSIPNKQICMIESETDVITNYHVTQILTLRQELIEALGCFPIKRKLKNVTLIHEGAGKRVYTAQSKELGPVVLKENDNLEQLWSEYKTLSKLHGTRSCKVFAFDEKRGQLLEEQILPGTRLREEPSLERRIAALKEVFDRIHLPQNDGESYLDWMEAVCHYCQEQVVDKVWKKRANQAQLICKEMFNKYTDRVLLHGDLHHDNMLLRQDGNYVIADPKGVVGPAIMDLPRFILNEWDAERKENDAQHIKNVIWQISECFGYPIEDIRQLLFMETVLANIWHMEDGEEVNEKQMETAEVIVRETWEE